MNPTEKFVRQATRGLWGRRKRDAQAELRGAIEDKIHRHRLHGLNDAEATAAALRDLGRPTAIAHGFREVHTLPPVLGTLLFVGLGATLGFQALAQVPTVQSAYLPSDLQTVCHLPGAQDLATISVSQREKAERAIKAQDGPDRALERCRKAPLTGRVLLNVADLLTALWNGGVTLPGHEEGLVMALRDGDLQIIGQDFASTTTPLFSFTGNRIVLPGLAFLTDEIQGQRYLSASAVIPFLKQVISSPLHLNGLTNPVLSVGPVNLQLGTPAAPVKTVDLLAFALLDERRTNSDLPLPVTLSVLTRASARDSHSCQLAIAGQDGELYAVVQNTLRLNGIESDALSVHSLGRGRLDLMLSNPAAPRLVHSVEDMDAATAQGQEAVLVYRLDASDLRDMKLTLVPAVQLKVQSPYTDSVCFV
ncbi:permease prefix domain 1-containing protein [Deinococcus radiopugnans]|uniref:Uncharacterized protein n=1 Tax=Deinococcus radiopugnans ATCC 19172 TaxID=585398 RepID=A0A5C4Y4P5_9DEIO|nr:permease prefix domain 1-containing protein [Deinococcus radiopugnans]MBB6016672.1 hypothetical protein [Deinococcus radiopugnans ATCC 19172]TNM70788.1 hypothetical protein FHR04_11490 [Deinococcus radiopugnans ATCC 19172]